jgi:hypothetical protein
MRAIHNDLEHNIGCDWKRAITFMNPLPTPTNSIDNTNSNGASASGAAVNVNETDGAPAPAPAPAPHALIAHSDNANLLGLHHFRTPGDQSPATLWLLQHGAAIPPADAYSNVDRYVWSCPINI